MSEGLSDPDLPPGAIVQTYGDGGALRNDGVKLTPASKNPWYVLATVAGEQEETQALYIDHELHARNRRFWNGWMCRGMCDAERLELAKQMGLSEAELSPLSEVEVQQLSERFQLSFQSTPPVEVVPKADESARFSSTYFPKAFSLERCFFVEAAFFDAAHFVGGVDFSAAHFSKAVYLSKVHFAENALSKETHFASGASFQEAYFVGKADFNSAYLEKKRSSQKHALNVMLISTQRECWKGQHSLVRILLGLLVFRSRISETRLISRMGGSMGRLILAARVSKVLCLSFSTGRFIKTRAFPTIRPCGRR